MSLTQTINTKIHTPWNKIHIPWFFSFPKALGPLWHVIIWRRATSLKWLGMARRVMFGTIPCLLRRVNVRLLFILICSLFGFHDRVLDVLCRSLEFLFCGPLDVGLMILLGKNGRDILVTFLVFPCFAPLYFGLMFLLGKNGRVEWLPCPSKRNGLDGCWDCLTPPEVLEQ